jgi:hypothetical protein
LLGEKNFIYSSEQSAANDVCCFHESSEVVRVDVSCLLQNISFIYQLFVVGTQFSVNRVPAFSCLRYFISQEHLAGVLSFGATK